MDPLSERSTEYVASGIDPDQHQIDAAVSELRSAATINARRREAHIRDRYRDETTMLGALAGSIGEHVHISVGAAGEVHQTLSAVDSEVAEFEAGGRPTWVQAAEIRWVELESEPPGAAPISPGSWLRVLNDLSELGLVLMATFVDGSTFVGDLEVAGGSTVLRDDRGRVRYCEPEAIALLTTVGKK